MIDSLDRMREGAARAIGRQIATGAEPEATRMIVLRLARALRMQQRLGRGGHWSYDLNRHLALAQAYRAERDRLAGLLSIRACERD